MFWKNTSKEEDTNPGKIIMSEDTTNLAISLKEIKDRISISKSLDTGKLFPGEFTSSPELKYYWEDLPINKLVIMILEYLNLEIEAERKIPMKLKEKEKPQ